MGLFSIFQYMLYSYLKDQRHIFVWVVPLSVYLLSVRLHTLCHILNIHVRDILI